MKNCNGVAHANGASSTDVTQCNCNFGYSYNPSSHTCFENCGGDVNSYPDPINESVCLCIQNYVKNSNGTCVRNCSNDANANGVSGSNISQCNCNSGFKWDSSKLKCIRNCSSIKFTSNIFVDDTSCACIDGFYWNTEKQNQY